ncbi:helix-turn-helix domain-containing protein [Halalkalicoccus sp. NIPERK01]|uniref:helix-turn-helix domain-containing protein n=1 Tax=Halalkalicoccus sp. NIPERK01 TaxID=3053469 RepID=UPI00256F5FB8|nr:helix-turn-helix domain-containing protein [Halalkalicoccus sp. NIPERK01]MDL5363095.1 helix-turn-helix domain-containing protein [Halalkalicoccus sp. NIPERK01]
MTNTHQHQLECNALSTITSSGAKLVYLYLWLENEATIDELHAALGLKKLTLYSLLQTLTATDLVERDGPVYVCQEQTAAGGNA